MNNCFVAMNDMDAQRKKVEAWHQRLNADGEVPPRWYRRNAVEYELICYINNIVGCYLARNYKSIPLFIQRCKGFLNCYTVKEEDTHYFEHISEYLLDLESLIKLHVPDSKYLSKSVDE